MELSGLGQGHHVPSVGRTGRGVKLQTVVQRPFTQRAFSGLGLVPVPEFKQVFSFKKILEACVSAALAKDAAYLF